MVSRKRVKKTLTIVSIVLISLTLVFVVYANSLFNLIDRTEFSGDPTISERDLANPEDLAPIDPSGESLETDHPSDVPAETTGTTTETSVMPTSSDQTTPTPEPTSTESTIPSETTMPTATTTETLSIPSLYKIPFSDDVYNILLIGTDTRSDGFTGRSDAMMILSVNRKTRKIHLVSLMRGLYVAIEGHDRSMLNNSYSWGGSRLLLQTIRENFRIAIDDYIVINFVGFKKAIDLTGGVAISLTEAEVEYMYLAFPDGSFKVGSNRLNGEEALCYARIRQIDSDYKRTSRQRKVIESLINQLETRSASQLDALVRELLPLVKTNLSRSRMISLAVNALKYKSYPVRQLMLPISKTYQTIIVRGVQMVQYDEAKNIEELHRFLYED